MSHSPSVSSKPGSALALRRGFDPSALAALFWLRPDTNGGQALLMIVVFAIVTGVGRLIWPTGS